MRAHNGQRTLCRALSQILACRRCEASFSRLVWPLRGQGVELFGHTTALLTASCQLVLRKNKIRI